MASATITGGKSVSLSLSGNEAVIAKNALANLSSQYSSSTVMKSPLTPPSSSPTSLDAYQINSAQYGSITAAPGAEAIVVTGGNGVNIQGNAGVRFIAGGTGNDTVHSAALTSLTGTLALGGGSDTLTIDSTATDISVTLGERADDKTKAFLGVALNFTRSIRQGAPRQSNDPQG